MTNDSQAPSRLRRAITGPLLFAFILGDVLGAGIYALMGVLSAEVGGMLWAPLLLALLLPLIVTPLVAKLFPTKKPVPAKDPGLARFVDAIARRAGGRVFTPDIGRLGEYVVSDYLQARRGRR